MNSAPFFFFLLCLHPRIPSEVVSPPNFPGALDLGTAFGNPARLLLNQSRHTFRASFLGILVMVSFSSLAI